MPITIGHATSHGFDQPLGLLTDCHRRVELFHKKRWSMRVAADGVLHARSGAICSPQEGQR